MATLSRTHVARKVHERECCACRGDIKPGQTYERQTVTPHDEEGGNAGPRMVTVKAHYRSSCEQQKRTGRYVDPDTEAALWNAVHPVGTPVLFYPAKDRLGNLLGTPTLARTSTPATARNWSSAVLWLDRPYSGGTGAVTVSFLVPVVSWALWREAAGPHERDSCDCGDGYGCSHGAWCTSCVSRDEDAGKRAEGPAYDWPCWPLLDALGITEPAVYAAIEGLMWERGYRCTVREDVQAWNAAHPGPGVLVRRRGWGGPTPIGRTAGPASYVTDHGMPIALVPLDNGERAEVAGIEPVEDAA